MVEGIWEVFIRGGKLHVVKPFVDTSDGFHNHAEPGWAVEDGV